MGMGPVCQFTPAGFLNQGLDYIRHYHVDLFAILVQQHCVPTFFSDHQPASQACLVEVGINSFSECLLNNL